MNAPQSLTSRLRERDGQSKIGILAHPLFWVVLGIKIATLLVLSGGAKVDLYSTFAEHFYLFPLANPYTWALAEQIPFPFPALMAYLLALSKLVFGSALTTAAAIRIPVLLADVAILLILARWLKHKQKAVLWYYWCSPVLFAISYIAGFLDSISIGFLFAFLYYLFKDKYLVAFTILGLALATKTGLIILLPFIAIYLFKEYERPRRAVFYLLISCAVYVLVNLRYLWSYEFWQSVLSGGQSFTSSFAIDFGGVAVYLVLLVYLALLASNLAFQRLNRDMFIMFLGLALGIVTLVVLPEAGWYSWILPFFIYFFIKEDHAQTYPFVALNIFYFAYFLVAPGSALVAAFPSLGTFTLSPVWVNITFTLLQGALLLTIIWIYSLGIQKGIRHKILYKPYVIGIAGDSASGKSTLTTLIERVFGSHNTLEVAGDDMHKWERGDPHWTELTHLNPRANKLHDDMEHVIRLKKNESVMRSFYDHAIGRFTKAERVRPKKIIVFQGLHALYLSRTRELLDLKIFLSPNENLRRAWKVERDTAERGHAPERVLQQLDARSADGERYINEQRKYADVVISFTQESARSILTIECDASLNIDPLVDMLKDNTSLTLAHDHNEGKQYLTCEGEVSGEIIEHMAYQLVPWISEINRREQQWDEGLRGVLQLFLAYIIFYKTRLDHDTFSLSR